MKRTLLLSLLLLAAPMAGAAEPVEVINLQGTDYTVSKKLPDEVVGEYLYEGNGEPIVRINADGTGIFQPHGMPGIPIAVWVDVDEKGEPRRQVGTELRYRYTLLIRYDGPQGGGNYPQGNYDLLGVTMLKDEGYALILGERKRMLN